MSSGSRRKLLYISAHFPPSAASGVFRTLGFLQGLTSRNWDISVLALKEVKEERVDRKLLERVPPQVSVKRTGYWDPFSLKSAVANIFRRKRVGESKSASDPAPIAEVKLCCDASPDSERTSWKDKISYILKTPDSYIGWVPVAVFRSLISLQRPGLILATAPPFSSLLIGVLLKKVWRVPVVVDLRDPWVLNPFRALRPGPAGKLDRVFEHFVLAHADGIVLNTDEARKCYEKYYPQYAGKMITITNGFDERFLSVSPRETTPDDCLRVIHVGALYGARSPVALLEAIEYFPEITVELYGPGTEKYSGLAGSRVLLSPSVEHNTAIALQKGADVVLLIGNCVRESVQIPAKLFEALAIARNIWLIDTADSPTRKLLRKEGIPHYFSLNEAAEIKATLEKIRQDWTVGMLSREVLPKGKIKKFSRVELSAMLDDFLLGVTERGSGGETRV
jgi:glycosyltransferase involved in cell wall biosynthesis